MRDRRTDPISVSSLEVDLDSNGNHPQSSSGLTETTAQNYKACFEHAGIGFSVTDLEGRVLEVNAAYCSITGYSEAELLSTSDLKTLTHPDDRAIAVERLNAVVAGETPGVIFEKRYVQKGGGIIWVQNSISLIRDQDGRPQSLMRLTQDITARKLAEASLEEMQAPDGTIRRLEALGSVVLDAQGVPVQMVGFCHDVTEFENTKEARRTAERKYRQIVENAGEGIFQSTPEGYYIMANPALARMHGFDSPGELIRSCRDISHQIYVDPARREEFKRLLEEHGVVRGFEHETLRKDGSRMWISINARAVRDEAGKTLYYEGTTQDISERKRAQEAARTYSRRVIEAQEAERRRISRELHDQVGQILTAVKMNLHALHQKCSTREILSSIEDNMKVIDEAVDQVRHLSVDLRPLLLDDFGLVIALRWYLDRQAKHGGVPADFISRSFAEGDRFSPELETACFRVVQEAVTNVVRHARATRISVLLEKSGPDLVLLLADNGAGFDVNALRNGPVGTATVGLVGMEERVQAVGGTLTIYSELALGTEICARFPIQETARSLPRAESGSDRAFNHSA